MEEIWKDIKQYEGYYQISNHGRVRSLDRYVSYPNYKKFVKGKIMKLKTKKKGYLFVILQKNHQSKSYHVHRLVGLHFLEGWFEGADINHKDGNKANNFLCNLEWCTRKENIEHSIQVLKRKGGNKNGGKRTPVIQIDREGNFLKRWDSFASAARSVGCKESCLRRSLTDGKQIRTCAGYKWILPEVYCSLKDKSALKNYERQNGRDKKVCQYDKNGKLLETFMSVKEASKVLGFNGSSIAACARGKTRTSYGFVWKYKE